MPSLGPLTAAAAVASLAPPETASAEIDVTKMDSASLQDVIQYSGVDLKAEAEMILREHDSYLANMEASASATANDPRNKPEHFFNGPRFRALIMKAAVSRGMVEVSEAAIDLVSAALQRRLASIISDLAEISKHRLDWDRMRFKIKIDNDPKKQLWLVDQIVADMAVEPDSMPSVQTLPASQSTPGGGSLASAEGGKAPKPPKKAEKRTSDDVLIKTKLANVTALAALGVQQKSWMSQAPTISQSPQQSESAPNPDSFSEGEKAVQQAAVKIPLHFSQAPSMTPLSDRDLASAQAIRLISIKDLLFYCENDPYLARSSLLISLYDVSMQ